MAAFSRLAMWRVAFSLFHHGALRVWELLAKRTPAIIRWVFLGFVRMNRTA